MKNMIRAKKGIPKVVVITDLRWTYEREFLLGVSQYAHTCGPWALYVWVANEKRFAQQLDIANADGIIAFGGDFKKNMAFVKEGLPAIVFTDEEGDAYNIPTIQDDEEAVGKLGAEHLLERRFTNFAFYGYADYRWAKRRGEGFRKRIAEAGFESSYYETRPSLGRQSLENERKRVADWLKSLPKPLGLMACDDEHSLNAVESCSIAELQIPQEVAILGVDNDNLLCNLSYPPRSSVVLAIQAAGYESAQLLDRFMRGEEKMMNQKIIVHPSYVATRLSTDVLSVEDTLVSKALQLIKENAHEKIQTSEIAEMLGISRQFLHSHFTEILGRSVHDEIKNVRTEQIASLLRETELTIEDIALRMGYNSANHLARYFKQAKGITPWEFRKKYKTSP
jgi:LacI family transcriptional regulator